VACDGWSHALLWRELEAAYEARVMGRSALLPALPVQYADFACWQRQGQTGEAHEAQLAYWKRQLADLTILDLPTDRIAESDLADVLWRDPSGIDILLAPPRVEMAEMVTSRDLDKIMSLLRRVYDSIVIDMSSAVSDVNLAFFDSSDTIIEIVTYDSTTIHNTIAMADTFRSIGYPASKVQYLVNRADSAGGIEADDLHRALGRVPEHRVVSDGQLVVRSNNEGVPFVLADPNAPVSQDIGRVAATMLGGARVPVAAGQR